MDALGWFALSGVLMLVGLGVLVGLLYLLIRGCFWCMSLVPSMTARFPVAGCLAIG
jgi:hypothetical protein